MKRYGRNQKRQARARIAELERHIAALDHTAMSLRHQVFRLEERIQRERIPGPGSGRTWRQLRRLPDGGIYIVATPGEVRHCEHILRSQGRHPLAVRIISADGPRDRLIDKLRGCSGTPYDIDHALFSIAPIDQALAIEETVGWLLDRLQEHLPERVVAKENTPPAMCTARAAAEKPI